MSAYIVSKTTMDKVVTAIDQHPHAVDIAKFVEPPLDSLDDIGKILYDMNLGAVLQRYPDENKETAPGPIDHSNILNKYEYTFPKGFTDLSGLNSIECLLHQSSEGDVSDSSMFQTLTKMAGEMALDIVSILPEYSKLGWDT